ncbi:hypothetical protein CALVIDRAFT_525240 [Calocera viscosa TUFC12733]|uniref:Uncharacterized protein n=1 Tax=Calocera viscosa (strain TUFC12733) TaxID=1330018 RepID=A0A167QEL4_CALVF|nr:hypothetical protein CALVIDRAFT_525240 [Calocera viscosa TUFC12733]
MAQVAPQPHVRFCPDAFLITDSPSRPIKPHLEARTLSLPLAWARKPNEADFNDPTFSPSRPTKLVVKIPRIHSPEREHPVRGCLHSPTSPPRVIPIILPPVSESSVEESFHSLSPISSPPNSGPTIAAPTVPLRPCCQACYNKMLLALQDDYVPKWSPGARRKKERDDREASMCSPSEGHCSIDAMLHESYQPFIFGGARVDEIEVRRGKGAHTKIDEEHEKEEEATDEDASDLSSPSRVHDLPNPFDRPKLAPLACLRGGSAVLKSVTSGEGNVNIKLL